jgi:hypothetical protein
MNGWKKCKSLLGMGKLIGIVWFKWIKIKGVFYLPQIRKQKHGTVELKKHFC